MVFSSRLDFFAHRKIPLPSCKRAQAKYRNDPRFAVRSAGISEQSPHRISGADLAWADLILVMEEKYASAIRTQFRRVALPPIKSLDIPDEYGLMDAELIELIRDGVEHQIQANGIK